MSERTGDAGAAEVVYDDLCGLPRSSVIATVDAFLGDTLGALWNAGWQPVDVARVVARRLGGTETEVLRVALADEARTYADLGRRAAPGWMAQLEDLGAAPRHERLGIARVEAPWSDVVAAAARLGGLLVECPVLPTLTPPPSQWHETMATVDTSRLPAGLLEKVRNLLAKAESTDFDAEAEAFTAKAQELMSRHRIDAAVLAAEGRADDEEPVGRRIGIDDPYAQTKALLLDSVAAANGGRTIWSKDLGFATVMAFAEDLDGIETLFTSLLVQSTAALQREGSKYDRFGRSRTTRFRRSFLVAFAMRIGDRLAEAAEGSVAEARAESGDGFLPVLVARDEAVRDATEQTFPNVRTFSASANDGEGWVKGTRFADLADVGVGERLERRPAP